MAVITDIIQVTQYGINIYLLHWSEDPLRGAIEVVAWFLFMVNLYNNGTNNSIIVHRLFRFNMESNYEIIHFKFM